MSDLLELIENMQYHRDNYTNKGTNKNRILYRKALLELMKACKKERVNTVPKKKITT